MYCKWQFYLRSAVLIVAGLLAGTDVLANEADTLCDVLDAGVEKWRIGLEFQCHFTFRKGVAYSQQEGLNGKFGLAVGKPKDEDKMVGTFAKLGEKVRLFVDYGRPPRDATGKGTSKSVTDVTCDMVTMNGLYLNYWPRYEKFGGTAEIAKNPKPGPSFDQNGLFTIETPFSFGGGIGGSPLTAFGPSSCGPGTLERSIVKPDSEHITVVLTLKRSDGGIQTRKVTCWTAVSPAVIQRIEDLSDNGKRHIEGVSIASQFVQCGKGMMARDLLSVTGPLTAIGASTPTWVVHHWTSEDLGQRSPTDDDFIVTIPPSVTVVGLKKPLPTGTERKLNLANYTVSDLGGPLPGELADRQGVGGRTTSGRVVLVACSVILVLLLFLFMWRRRTFAR